MGRQNWLPFFKPDARRQTADAGVKKKGVYKEIIVIMKRYSYKVEIGKIYQYKTNPQKIKIFSKKIKKFVKIA